MSSLLLVTMFALAARPGFEDGAPVLRAAAFDGPAIELAAPTAPAWASAEAFEIPLRRTPPHPRSDATPVETVDKLEVRALAASDGIAIRINWRDATDDLLPSDTGEISRFPDGVAVQFPAGSSGKVLPALAMGLPEHKVNIWHWIAGNETAEEGIAEGFGRLQAVDGETPVHAAAARVDGGWAVTLWRPYQVEPVVTYRGVDPGTGGQAERVVIQPGARLPCAFAVWNGAWENRGGLKAVSIWYYLQLPAP